MSTGWTKNGFVYLLILVAAAALFFSIFPQGDQSQAVELTTVAEWIKRGDVEAIRIRGDELLIKRRGSVQPVLSRKEPGVGLTKTLLALGVSPEQLKSLDLQVEPIGQLGNWLALLGSLLPLVFVGALFFFLLRQAQGSNNQAIAFGKSRARMFTGDKPTVTFDD
ncbi:MAG: cell division protein FtsH, partial [Anaerolineae bacterium]|nr:cell division protein FtsH [Anaerolineae bacterium]